MEDDSSDIPPQPLWSAVFLLVEGSIPLGPLLVEGIILLILLYTSALISGSEVAFFSLTREEINQCTESRNFRERIVARLAQRPKFLLATILIVNNLVNVAIVMLSTYMTWQVFGKDEGVAIAVLTFLVTFLIVFFGEVVPKVFAQHKGLAFARFTSQFIAFSASVFRPLAWLLTHLGQWIEKRFRRKAPAPISIQQLHQVLDAATTAEPKDARLILKRVMNFGKTTVRQVMRSRMEIQAFEKNTPFRQLVKRIRENGYSRLPIYANDLDNIVGILYAKDLLGYLHEKEDFVWHKLVRTDVLFIPESKRISELFKDFQEKHVHIAIVIDEFGGTLGLVTLEDIIEEVVGDIQDEFDQDEERLFSANSDNEYLVKGKMTIHDFCREVGADEEKFAEIKGESESIGGLMLELFSRLPNEGEQIEGAGFSFTIEATDPKRVQTVRVQPLPSSHN